MLDLLMPATDEGVAAQFVLLLMVTGVGAWFARHNKDVLRLVVGLALLFAGMMAIRAIH